MNKNCAILSIGNELLFGLTVDTNAAYLCREVSELGWNVTSVRTIGDYTGTIASTLLELAKDNKVIICSGGLGPTEDDRTRAAIAEAAGCELEERAELVEQIKKRFEEIRRPMADVNRVQAQIPTAATGIHNTCGTAPGIRCPLGEATVYSTPGVPKEMKAMYQLSIRPEMMPRAGEANLYMRRIHLFGLGESNVGLKIRDIMTEGANPQVGTTVDNGIITIRLTAKGNTEKDARKLAMERSAEVEKIFDESIVGFDGCSLAVTIVNTLKESGATLSLAESCTGGMIASQIVDIPGASDILAEGVVSYSNEAKMRLLGVKKSTLEANGAVSTEVAAQMATGARNNSASTYALSVTGIAGPGGGTAEKPVGTVCIGLATPDGVWTVRLLFGMDRYGNRIRSSHAALDMLRRHIQGKPMPENSEFKKY